MVEATLRARLIGYHELNQLIGDRVTPYYAAEGDVLPFVTYDVSELKRQQTLNGGSHFVTGEVDFNVHSSTFAECVQVTKLVEDLLQDFRIVDEDNNCNLKKCIVSNTAPAFEAPSDGTGEPTYMAVVTVKVMAQPVN